LIAFEHRSRPSKAPWRDRRACVRRSLAALSCVAVLGALGDARAQERGAGQKAAAAPKSRVVTISEVTIVGRIQKPIAAVDVSRIQPKLTLAELRQPFLQGIEKAIYSSPF
jgi:hypothetical protein